jgi:hypothetical protein
VEDFAVIHGPDFVLEVCTVIGALGGLLIGLYTGWLFPSAAAGLAVGLAVGGKLNPDTHESH